MSDPALKPPAQLPSTQLEQISDAIVDSFSPNELKNTLRFKWGIILENYVNQNQGFVAVVADLIGWTERRGRTLELALLAFAERPGNGTVQRMASSLGLSMAEAEAKYDLAKQVPTRPPLEAMVSKYSRLIDYQTFLSRFKSLGDRICRIETPFMLGTGFLVGADLVLTNFHVIEGIKTPNDAAKITCQFDFHNESSGKSREAPKNNVKTCRLAPEWIVAQSPYSDSDVSGRGDPAAGELDYALLRLAEDMGNAKAPEGSVRGWFNLSADRPLLAIRDFVVIPQHAKGEPLEVAWGAVLSFSSLGTRVRYDTRTDSGSSGSPCLTVDLEIFGLHHATDPKNNPQYNQAIPVDLIASDLRTKRII